MTFHVKLLSLLGKFEISVKKFLYFGSWKKLGFKFWKKPKGTTLLLHLKNIPKLSLETLWNFVKYSETLWNYLIKVNEIL